MSELFAEPVEDAVQLVTARRSLGEMDTSVRVETPNYDYYYLCTELRRKRIIPVITKIRGKSGEPRFRHCGASSLAPPDVAGPAEVDRLGVDQRTQLLGDDVRPVAGQAVDGQRDPDHVLDDVHAKAVRQLVLLCEQPENAEHVLRGLRSQDAVLAPARRVRSRQ